jgi:hypothetical protein
LDAYAFTDANLRVVRIPCSVEFIGDFCFSGPQRYSLSPPITLVEVEFEANSSLKEMGYGVFSRVAVDKIEIPKKCEVLSGLAIRNATGLTISEDNPFFVVETAFIKTADEKSLVRYLGRDEKIAINEKIEIISTGCFSGCKFLCEVTFESNSSLRCIERIGFEKCGLKSIQVPASVESIGAFCFCECSCLCEVTFESESLLKEIGMHAFDGAIVSAIEIPKKCEKLSGLSILDIENVAISEGNPFFVMDESFLKTSDKKVLVRYLGIEKKLVIGKDAEEISDGCFTSCQSLEEIRFEPGSRLRKLGKLVFRLANQLKIWIPASVESIGKGCFSWGCGSSVFLEAGSRLQHVGKYAFEEQMDDVRVPRGMDLRFLGDHLVMVYYDDPVPEEARDPCLFSFQW